MSRILIFLVLIATTLFAQDKMMAIVDVQLQGDAKKYFTAEERQYLSTAIRAQASQILGDKVEILSQAKFKKLVKANSEGCSEAGCFAGFVAEIGVDLGMQPTVSYAFGKLKMSLEVADSKATIGSRTLSAAATQEGKNTLGEQAEIAAKELFTEVAVRLGYMPGTPSPSLTKTTAPTPQPAAPKEAQAPEGMVRIPAGCFNMGSNDGGPDEKPVHQVCLSGFAMDKYEVTQGDYQRAIGDNPSRFNSCGNNCPVENVDWTQAKYYCESQGKRLPTEAEWEYAARAGSTTQWYCGNYEGCLVAISWYDANSKSHTHPVGQKKPNAWGLYDMTGNVWEWTSDWYGNAYYGQSPGKDPQGPSSGPYRVYRGGSWSNAPSYLRSALRGGYGPSDRLSILGFRCVSSR